ncbi:MAG: flagellar motor protein MotB [Steroidobacteraceae bacterium]
MAEADKRPIIIVKKRRAAEGGHHGGAWKVAYADFVTALMAFFLVMWLVASVSKEQRAAMFDYFKNPSMEQGKSVKAAPGQMGPGGASTSAIDLGGGMDAPKSNPKDQDEGLGKQTPDIDEARKVAEQAERKQLESLMEELREAIDKSQALKPFKDQLLLDITPEGLRIQIVDAQNRAMFDLGSSRLKDYTDNILRELSSYLNTVPNRISISGHTDIVAYGGRGDYSNWELSADRANAARRALERGGLDRAKIARIVGLSSAVLFNKEDPRDPINRRISIIVMTKRAEEAALKTDVFAAMDAPATAAADALAAPGEAAVTPSGEAAVTPPEATEAAADTPPG